MKRFFFALGCSLAFSWAYSAVKPVEGIADEDQVLMTINGDTILKSEFVYHYNKNKSNLGSEKDVKAYLDLFIDFKLKVAEAKAQNLQNKQSYIDDFREFKKQLALPYLIDKDVEKKEVEKAFERMKETVEMSHIFFRRTTETRNKKLYATVDTIMGVLKNRGSFAEMAYTYSHCKSRIDNGYVGYYNVGNMPLDYEDVAYSTAPGTFSEPFTTSDGLYIIKVHSRKPNVTSAKVSHIFIPYGKGNSERKIDSIYSELEKGADFMKMAETYSTAVNAKDGYSFWVDFGIFPPDFVEPIKEMKSGEMKKFRSSMGYNIVKCDSTSMDLKIKKEDYANIRSKFEKLNRLPRLLDRTVEKIKNASLSKIYPEALVPFEKILYLGSFRERWDALNKLPDDPVFVLNGKIYSQKDMFGVFQDRTYKIQALWIGKGNWSMLAEVNPGYTAEEFTHYVLDETIKMVIMEDLYSDLYKKNTQYRNALNEYSDGLLLFDITEKEVWKPAARDRKAMEDYFKRHKGQYMFDKPKFRGAVAFCADKKIAKKTRKMLESGIAEDSVRNYIFEKYKKDYEVPVRIEHGLFEKGKSRAVDAYVFNSGEYVPSETLPIVFTYGGLVSTPDTYGEVRGQVLAGVQAEKEKEWVNSLREKYVVDVNYDVLNTIK